MWEGVRDCSGAPKESLDFEKNRSPNTNWALAQLGDVSYWAFSALDILMWLPTVILFPGQILLRASPQNLHCLRFPVVSSPIWVLSLGSLSSIPILVLRLPRTNELMRLFFPLIYFLKTHFFSFPIFLSFFPCSSSFSSSFSLLLCSNPLLLLLLSLWSIFHFKWRPVFPSEIIEVLRILIDNLKQSL